MKAIVCSSYGTPEQLTLENLPDPVPGPQDLLVKVHASSVNFPDSLTIAGRYQVKHALPFVPGSEASGVVEAVGAQVDGFAPGDRVALLTSIGGFAEKVAAPAATAIKLGDDIPFDFAAAFHVAYGTSYLALVHQAKLRAGETVLVLGAAGGVGLAAIEIAKALGARVVAAASSPEKLEIAHQAGADMAVDYTREDLKARVRALTDGHGVDVVYDPVGDRYSEPALRAIAWEGRYLVIGFAAGEIPRIPLNLLLLKSASAIGVFWGDWAARNPDTNAAHVAEIFAMYARGEIKAQISRRYPLAETPAALRWMMERNATGKIVIEI
jgi:NADPH2:quinone reductase